MSTETQSDVLRCKLMRCEEQESWLEYQNLCFIETSMDRETQKILSFVIRDSDNNSLVADFPRTSLRAAVLLQQLIIELKTTSETTRVALKFSDFRSFRRFTDTLDQNEVQIIDQSTRTQLPMLPSARSASAYEGNLPDLEDPVIQEMVLRLLFREDFKKFVVDLAVVLEAMQENLEEFPYR